MHIILEKCCLRKIQFCSIVILGPSLGNMAEAHRYVWARKTDGLCETKPKQISKQRWTFNTCTRQLSAFADTFGVFVSTPQWHNNEQTSLGWEPDKDIIVWSAREVECAHESFCKDLFHGLEEGNHSLPLNRLRLCLCLKHQDTMFTSCWNGHC